MSKPLREVEITTKMSDGPRVRFRVEKRHPIPDLFLFLEWMYAKVSYRNKKGAVGWGKERRCVWNLWHIKMTLQGDRLEGVLHRWAIRWKGGSKWGIKGKNDLYWTKQPYRNNWQGGAESSLRPNQHWGHRTITETSEVKRTASIL